MCVSGQLWRTILCLYTCVCVFQLTGPEVGIGAHHAHDQGAGDPPGQRRALWERPSDLQGHRSAPGSTSTQVNLEESTHVVISLMGRLPICVWDNRLIT